jgi:hypothetical protein
MEVPFQPFPAVAADIYPHFAFRRAVPCANKLL